MSATYLVVVIDTDGTEHEHRVHVPEDAQGAVHVRNAYTNESLLAVDLRPDHVEAGHWPAADEWGDGFTVTTANPYPNA